jgi:uncharacterized membrane protein YedE/YeeE
MTAAMATITPFLAGLVLGIGLIVSRMADPAKVQGFLDLAGAFDPSLAFVMAGALVVAAPAFAIARRRRVSMMGTPIAIPASRDVDRRLVAGSTLFGIGWGLAGFCPAPALVVLGTGNAKAVVFVAAMLAGMAIFEWREQRRVIVGAVAD